MARAGEDGEERGFGNYEIVSAIGGGGMGEVMTHRCRRGSTATFFFGGHSAFIETSHTCHGESDRPHPYSLNVESTLRRACYPPRKLEG